MKSEAIQGIVLFQIGTVEIQKNNSAFVPVSMQDSVAENDIIKTGAHSFVTIQFEERGVIRVQDNTTLQFTKFFSDNKAEFFLKEGQVLSKINRLKKNEQFIVKTPTAVASVRGTEFSTSYENNRSAVAVKNGEVIVGKKLSANQSSKDDSYIQQTNVSAGKTAVVTESVAEKESSAEVKIDLRPISDVENLTLEKIAAVEIVKDVKNKSTKDLEELKNNLLKKEVEINIQLAPKVKEEKIQALIAKRINSLEEIKEVFERIDEITLYNRRVVTGAIITRGNVYTVLTTNGTVEIQENEIKGIRVIK